MSKHIQWLFRKKTSENSHCETAGFYPKQPAAQQIKNTVPPHKLTFKIPYNNYSIIK